jgi:hypothetical protein
MKTLFPIPVSILHNRSIHEPVPKALAALGLLLTLNLHAQVNTANTSPANATTQVISTNAAQAVTMVVVQGQPTASATAGSISPMSSTCTPCPDSAVAWWAAEGNTSDSLGAHNGTAHNWYGYAQGQIGQAFDFTGANFVEIANSGLIFSSWSFEAWVNPTTTITSQVWLVGQSYGRQLVLRPGDSGPKVTLAVSTSPYNWWVLEGAEIPTNAWSHVVGVCDSASGTLKVYVNGTGGSTTLGLVPWDSGCPWTIGGADLCGYSGQFFTGGLDEVTIYDAALTSAQVQALYSARVAGKCTPALNATRDLLLIYNTSSSQSRDVKDYYLAHRPMVAGANVLPITCPPQYTISSTDFTNMVQTPLTNWLNARPTLRPQYIVLFLDVPSRINEETNAPPCYPATSTNSSVSYFIYANLPFSGYHPYVTHINMRDNDTTDPYYNHNTTSACLHYIDKLASFGAQYSLGKLLISPSAGGYNSNPNYIVDNVRHGGPSVGCYNPNEDYSDPYCASFLWAATNGLLTAGVPASAILYAEGLEDCTCPGPSCCGGFSPHITNAVNVAGYVSWGSHSSLCNQYAIAATWQGAPTWQGSSGWWIIETLESFNGQPAPSSGCGGGGMGDFNMWFDHRAFGGYDPNHMDYQNTPVGAVTHVDEPFLSGVNNTSTYFGLWASGADFATCAWTSKNWNKLQAVGDPFVTR